MNKSNKQSAKVERIKPKIITGTLTGNGGTRPVTVKVINHERQDALMRRFHRAKMQAVNSLQTSFAKQYRSVAKQVRLLEA